MKLIWLKTKFIELAPKKDEVRYSRAYVSELASQFREQELILVTIK